MEGCVEMIVKVKKLPLKIIIIKSIYKHVIINIYNLKK